MRRTTRVAGGLAAVLLALLVAFAGSSRCALDYGMAHSAATAALPAFSAGSTDGLVRVSARGREFRTRVAGLDHDGPAVLMLHGFPETSASWEPLLEAAARAGYRAAAFDQRGYSPGARPLEVEAYALPELVADAVAVADALGFARFHLVGHDGGSVVGWALVDRAPERMRTWASLSIPHPGAILASRGDAGTPAYMRVFRLPGVAEALLLGADKALLRRLIYADMPEALEAEYLAVFSEPGALTAALNWYRAGEPPAVGDPVHTPVLWIWGEREMPLFVAPEVREQMPRFVAGPYRELRTDAGHWLMEEDTQRVVAAVMEHWVAHDDGTP